ncbi:ankyrin repeat domain-containing protein [Alteromonas sediminis]|uniref:Ankyrin repeat domain-containing protein n=1 Tax=Alteromonas sediminis TaxID=2259342 RepID=A0A3N5YQ51_9ALTE|nr:ankyrin repeat domain-containing protein [Alteromonas sediminis]RPJ68131.1 ankyrin repeat domain-containing protein [Alteromonas sediminis]
MSLAKGPIENDFEIRKALNDGADPNAFYIENSNLPLIHVAAMKADLLSLRALIDHGAEVNREAGTTVGRFIHANPIDLTLFSSIGEPLASTQLLIEAGAELHNSQILNGACYRGDIKLFQEFKPLVLSTAFDDKGYGCLHMALEKRHFEFIRKLLTLEANTLWLQEQINFHRNNGSTPLDLAVVNKNYEIAYLIYLAGGRANREWTYSRIKEAQGKTAQEQESLYALKSLIHRAEFSD